MKNIDLFITRIIIDNKVYLLAKDVRKALGYRSIEQLQIEHAGIVKHIKDLPTLVLESDFNTILIFNIDAIEDAMRHFQMI